MTYIRPLCILVALFSIHVAMGHIMIEQNTMSLDVVSSKLI